VYTSQGPRCEHLIGAQVCTPHRGPALDAMSSQEGECASPHPLLPRSKERRAGALRLAASGWITTARERMVPASPAQAWALSRAIARAPAPAPAPAPALPLQIAPKYSPVPDGPLVYEDVVALYEEAMEWLAGVYVNTMNCIHYM